MPETEQRISKQKDSHKPSKPYRSRVFPTVGVREQEPKLSAIRGHATFLSADVTTKRPESDFFTGPCQRERLAS